jgi:hypothetical protein
MTKEEKIEKFKKEFDNEWKNLNDWAGSGFRYNDSSLTKQGLIECKERILKLFLQTIDTL